MDKRLQKQLVIAIIFFSIVGAFSYNLISYLVPPKPSPTPDPTANLIALKVKESILIPIDENDFDYDFVAHIENPNPNYGALSFDYKIDFIDANGSIINSKIGRSYLAPGASKFIIESPLRFNSRINKYSFSVSNTQWSQVDAFLADNIKLILQNKPVFETRDIPGVYGIVAGSIRNLSQFNIDSVDVAVVLRSSSGSIIGVAKTSLNTFLKGTSRGFETRWFRQLSDIPDRVDVYFYTNIFALENIIRASNGGQIERFQEF